MSPPKCCCGHAKRNHAFGSGLCLVKSCRLCLVFRPAVAREGGAK